MQRGLGDVHLAQNAVLRAGRGRERETRCANKVRTRPASEKSSRAGMGGRRSALIGCGKYRAAIASRWRTDRRISRVSYHVLHRKVRGGGPEAEVRAHLQDPLDERRAVIHVPRGRGVEHRRARRALALPERRHDVRPHVRRRGGLRGEVRVRVAQLSEGRAEERAGERALGLLEVLPVLLLVDLPLPRAEAGRVGQRLRVREAQVLVAGRLHRRFGVYRHNLARIARVRAHVHVLVALLQGLLRPNRPEPEVRGVERGGHRGRLPQRTLACFASRARRVASGRRDRFEKACERKSPKRVEKKSSTSRRRDDFATGSSYLFSANVSRAVFPTARALFKKTTVFFKLTPVQKFRVSRNVKPTGRRVGRFRDNRASFWNFEGCQTFFCENLESGTVDRARLKTC